MVARSAFAQLDYSPILLLGTLIGLFIVYIAPVLGALFAMYYVQLAAYLAWAIMAVMFQPDAALLSPFALVGPALAGDRRVLCRVHSGFRAFSTGRARAACGREGRKRRREGAA